MKLKKNVRKVLTVIAVVLGVFLASIDDFTLGAMPMVLALAALEVANLTILEKF